MKKILFFSALAASLIFTSFTLIEATDLKLTDGYSIRVYGKKINGFFHSLKGQVKFDENNLSSSSCNLEIAVASITTGNSLKSWHAKRKKWFDAKKHPNITFVSSKFSKTPKGYLVNGKLTMKGVEKEVAIPFSFNKNIFYGNFYVKRSDYNIGKMKGFSKMVSDTIRIDFTIPVTK